MFNDDNSQIDSVNVFWPNLFFLKLQNFNFCQFLSIEMKTKYKSNQRKSNQQQHRKSTKLISGVEFFKSKKKTTKFNFIQSM